jgi:hypothetical protein
VKRIGRGIHVIGEKLKQVCSLKTKRRKKWVVDIIKNKNSSKKLMEHSKEGMGTKRSTC